MLLLVAVLALAGAALLWCFLVVMDMLENNMLRICGGILLALFVVLCLVAFLLLFRCHANC